MEVQVDHATRIRLINENVETIRTTFQRRKLRRHNLDGLASVVHPPKIALKYQIVGNLHQAIDIIAQTGERVTDFGEWNGKFWLEVIDEQGLIRNRSSVQKLKEIVKRWAFALYFPIRLAMETPYRERFRLRAQALTRIYSHLDTLPQTVKLAEMLVLRRLLSRNCAHLIEECLTHVLKKRLAGREGRIYSYVTDNFDALSLEIARARAIQDVKNLENELERIAKAKLQAEARVLELGASEATPDETLKAG